MAARGTLLVARSEHADEPIEGIADVSEGARKEVAVGVERDVDRAVAELRLEELGMGARATMSAA